LFPVGATVPSVELEIRLLDRSGAERVMRGARARDPQRDLPWAKGYPLDGDARACAAYVNQIVPGTTTNPFGYYQILIDGVVVGGIGFHGPPRDGLVEVGYGVVPDYRRRGVATEALRRLLELAVSLDGVRRVCGRVGEDNVPSQKVMAAVGMQLVGRDPDFLHYELELG
jgi:RimJ/RimL family protein N-acetyltransferase